MKMFNSFPRECGPPRKTVNNIREWLKFINLYNGRKKAVYTSIYKFNEINDNNKPNYKSAVIDKIFFDFDDKSCDAWKECNIFHNELIRENLKHCIIMSGRGYHLYIMTQPYQAQHPKSCIYNSQHRFIDNLNLSVDKQVIGNPAQLARVPNTYNIKGKRYCIPLTQEQFEKGDKFIKKLASKQNFIKDIFIGEKLLDIKIHDFVSEKFDEQIVIKDDDFGDSGNVNYMKDAPNCIKRLLQLDNIGWKERYLIILFYREMGYTRQEVFNILKEHLSTRKLKHCVHDERQLQYLFDRYDLVFPTCSKIINDGFCKKKCTKYNKIIYK